MKTISTLLLLFLSTSIYSQDVPISQKFFTTEKTRLSVDVGLDLSWANSKGESSLVKSIGNLNSELIKYRTMPNTTVNIGFDIYSPLSTLGFYVAANLNTQQYTIHNTNNQLIDSISNKNIEIPLYLKFRIGKANRKSHLWLAIGGGYSIPIKVNNTSYFKDSKINFSDDKNLFKNTPFLSSMIGYEFLIPFSGSEGRKMYNRDDFRVLLYAKGNYDLSNRINPDFQFQNNTSIGQINNQDFEFLRISFGIKVLMRITKFKKLLDEAIKETIKK